MIGASGLVLRQHVPERYAELALFEFTGDSYIIDPRGEIIAGPAKGETILVAQGSMEAVMAAKVANDAGGHYSRPDQLQLHIDGKPLRRLVESGKVDTELDQQAMPSKNEAVEAEEAQRDSKLKVAR